MVWVATAIAGSSLLGAYSANNAANAQSTAANNALAFNNKMFNTVNSNEAPYLQNGAQASQQLSAMMPQLTSSFTNADLNANLAPNYAFTLDMLADAGVRVQAKPQEFNVSGGQVRRRSRTGCQE